VLPVTDAALLSKDADGTLMVVASGQTKRIDLRRATEKLAQVNANVIGALLNETTRQTGYGYGYGYGYAYGYASDPRHASVPVPANGSAAMPANDSAAMPANGSAPGSEANGNGPARVLPRGPDARG
jgi:Mrp family chromosome partitioning ATPase